MTGRRVVNSRATHQLSRLSLLLEQQGAEVLEYPCIAIAPPLDTAPLCDALAESASFDWLVLTSANTVTALASLGFLPQGLKIAAVGPSTAAAARAQLGVEVALLPEHFMAESLAQVLPIQARQRVLIPASSLARPALAETLQARGALVTVVEAYRTVLGSGGAPVPALLSEGKVNAITFTSSSTVENFLVRLDAEGGRRSDLESVCLAAIGPQTAATMREQGLTVSVLPEVNTLDGLVAALYGYYLSK